MCWWVGALYVGGFLLEAFGILLVARDIHGDRVKADENTKKAAPGMGQGRD